MNQNSVNNNSIIKYCSEINNYQTNKKLYSKLI